VNCLDETKISIDTILYLSLDKRFGTFAIFDHQVLTLNAAIEG